MARRSVDLAGRRFGRLLVIERFGVNSHRHAVWKCKCDCGNDSEATTPNLKSGGTLSCGCIKREMDQERLSKPNRRLLGKSKRVVTPEYHSWASMLVRVRDVGGKRTPHYGARGIKVCDRWLSFDNFLVDMGSRPKGTTLERKDTNGDYTPDNCVWATSHDQSRNKRTNVFAEWNGKRMCLEDWARETGIRSSLLGQRLKKWSVEKSLTMPAKRSER